MTLLDQAAARVADAVESRHKVASRLHPPGSFDLDDHPVPTGREEAWRFTPIKRLRGLHDGTFVAGGGARVDVQAPPEVTVDLEEVAHFAPDSVVWNFVFENLEPRDYEPLLYLDAEATPVRTGSAVARGTTRCSGEPATTGSPGDPGTSSSPATTATT